MESWSILGFLDSIGNGLLGRSLSLASILLPLLDPFVHGEQAAFFPPLLLSCRQFCLDSAFVLLFLASRAAASLIAWSSAFFLARIYRLLSA